MGQCGVAELLHVFYDVSTQYSRILSSLVCPPDQGLHFAILRTLIRFKLIEIAYLCYILYNIHHNVMIIAALL